MKKSIFIMSLICVVMVLFLGCGTIAESLFSVKEPSEPSQIVQPSAKDHCSVVVEGNTGLYFNGIGISSGDLSIVPAGPQWIERTIVRENSFPSGKSGENISFKGTKGEAVVITESWQKFYTFEKGHNYHIKAVKLSDTYSLAYIELIDGELKCYNNTISIEIDRPKNNVIQISIIHKENSGIEIKDVNKRMLGNTFVGFNLDDSFALNLWRPKGVGPSLNMGYGIRPGVLISNGYFNTIITGDIGGSFGFSFPGPFKEVGMDLEGYVGGLIEYILPVVSIAGGGGIAFGFPTNLNSDSNYVYATAINENGEEAVPVYFEADLLFRDYVKDTIQLKFAWGLTARYYINVGSTFSDKFAAGVKLVF